MRINQEQYWIEIHESEILELTASRFRDSEIARELIYVYIPRTETMRIDVSSGKWSQISVSFILLALPSLIIIKLFVINSIRSWFSFFSQIVQIQDFGRQTQLRTFVLNILSNETLVTKSNK